MTSSGDQNGALLREMTPRNVLSFGPGTAPIRLGPLNVLIGPNGSGKSNVNPTKGKDASRVRIVVEWG
jgi:hypothetical protein